MELPGRAVFNAGARALLGAMLGALVGLTGLLVGGVRAGLLVLRGGTLVWGDFWSTTGWYLAGFAAGGAVMGAFWPSRPARGRQYLAGMLAGLVVEAAVARIVDGPIDTWTARSYVLIALLGPVYGAAFTWGLR